MPKFFMMQQRTPEWFAIHAGKITASRMCDLMAYSKQKGKEGQELKARADYRDELIAERMTGQMSQHFVTEQMKRGTEEEQWARSAYEQKFQVPVDEVGFVLDSEHETWGASPDGIVRRRGGNLIVEIKNLTTVNHLKAVRSGTVPPDYVDQILWTMARCGYRDNHYVSYDSRLLERYPDTALLAIAVPYDEQRVAELEAEAVKMDAEIRATMEKFKA